ncbi:DNA/RNA non-specific endonuclease [Alteromonas macleodii]|uniref:DNA/RNA non-specific endonuclease n=1 Tax=Alteromonas macleodii TaxID=28108 RepID=UPI0015863BE5|nr:DNA/RNA non-specific endonuclease [Alteromonas macleodii]
MDKTAEVTGMDDVIEKTKRDINNVTNALNLDERQYVTELGPVFKREHQAYTLYISCLHRGPLYGYMLLGKDQGNLPRLDGFTVDKEVPAECRQISTSSYSREYHRGQLFDSNHFDGNERHMFESFYMSNVIPQHEVANTGAWKATEIITECYREHHQLYLAAGVLYGTDTTDDEFVESHGVVTPTAMWKYIELDKDKYAAWIIPNSKESTKESLASLEVTLEDLLRITNIQITPNARAVKRVALPIFQNCHLS